jgi:hypothetical protein
VDGPLGKRGKGGCRLFRLEHVFRSEPGVARFVPLAPQRLHDRDHHEENQKDELFD